MYHANRSRRLTPIFLATTFLIPLHVLAQGTLDQLGKGTRNAGMDEPTFRQFFGPAFKAGLPSPALSRTAEDAAQQIAELRLFLTAEPNVVSGEIVLAGKTSLNELTFALEEGPVRFVATAPNVFKARFRMDTAAAWQVLRRHLQASNAVLQSAGARQFIRRGPRDIVPAKEAIAAFRAQAPAFFAASTEGAGRVAEMVKTNDPMEAAKIAQADIARTPLLSVPGPAFAPATRFPLQRVLGLPVIGPFPFPFPPVTIDQSRSLMVIATGVVEDPGRAFDPCTGTGTPGGPWSFGHLMRELSQGTGLSPEDFAMLWLSTWIVPQAANGFVVNDSGKAGPLQSRVIASWQNLSGTTLNIDKFPARLLAIVNRPDLADKIGYGVAGSAGEGRFVFGLLEKPAGATGCNSLPFTVIFEYGIKGGSCLAVKAWHQRWKNLDAFALGSAAYNGALEAITRDFTEHGTNPSQTPNQSSLNQLRTDEIALGIPWQLREFRLESTGSSPPGTLNLVTVKQTPDESFRNGTTGTATIGAFLVAKEGDILADRHVVPERFPGLFNPFLGAKADNPFPPSSTFWTAPGLTTLGLTDPAETRRKFSLATCNACHGGETGTFFTHIGTLGERTPGSPAALSGFLTGIDVTVPVTGGIHHYADLDERAVRMSEILTNPCFPLLGVRRLPFVH